MRRNLLAGLGLVVAAVILVAASATFDLELEGFVLLGVAVGAVLALVPDASPTGRLAGFSVGVLAAWAAYLLRAALLPDSSAGRAVAFALVLAVCAGVAVASSGRLPLWATVLGAGALAGAYEGVFTAAPAEVAETSVTAVTALLVAVAGGLLAGLAAAGPRTTTAPAAELAGGQR